MFGFGKKKKHKKIKSEDSLTKKEQRYLYTIIFASFCGGLASLFMTSLAERMGGLNNMNLLTLGFFFFASFILISAFISIFFYIFKDFYKNYFSS